MEMHFVFLYTYISKYTKYLYVVLYFAGKLMKIEGINPTKILLNHNIMSAVGTYLKYRQIQEKYTYWKFKYDN